ncbi:MAG: protein kinase [Planctomycetota bacterium]
MRFEDRWETLNLLGKGGQGEVWLAQDKGTFKSVKEAVVDAVMKMNLYDPSRRAEACDRFREAGKDLLSPHPDKLAALKVLHKPEDARDPERAAERIQREMKAMSEVSHPNLLRIKDADPVGAWFAAEYHPNGPLSKRLDLSKGDFPRALKAFRPLVAGVAELHAQGIVHRDIKPENIFTSLEGELVLGDFGLVFFADDKRTRLSPTLENVGSRDWMPAWAMGMRIEEIKPTFDVFSLGKVLWSMVSGDPFLRLWYFSHPEFNLEVKSPNGPSIQFANQLLAKCVVEDERKCLPDAEALLAEIDKVLLIIQRGGDLLGEEIERPCRVCGVGDYKVLSDNEIDNSPFRRPAGQRGLKVFTCNHCGHVQLFLFPDKEKKLPAWSESN